MDDREVGVVDLSEEEDASSSPPLLAAGAASCCPCSLLDQFCIPSLLRLMDPFISITQVILLERRRIRGPFEDWCDCMVWVWSVACGVWNGLRGGVFVCAILGK